MANLRIFFANYSMPVNKVVGLLNPKILEDRSGKGELSLSVDHPDKIMEMGDAIDCGTCKATKANGGNYNYKVFNMDWGHFKELLWLHFWYQAFPPIIFMVEKCVYFDNWNKNIFENFKGSSL